MAMSIHDNMDVKIGIPQPIARITLCGAISLVIEDDIDFVFPTEEQRKNLKEMLCIEVEDLRKNHGDEKRKG